MTSCYSKPRLSANKNRTVGVSLLATLCLAAMTLTQVTNAQYFAQMDYSKAKDSRFSDDGEEKSAVDQLDANSSWIDLMAAHQSDMF